VGTLQCQIDQLFEGKAFERPLFYNYDGGLRFELSKGGSSIEKFLLAITRATTICADIFDANSYMVVCLRAWVDASRFSLRKELEALRGLGLKIPNERCIWADPSSDEDLDGRWVSLAFRSAVSQIQSLLWIACASDFSSIAPRPMCSVYLFDMEKGVLVFPYDDRGMDVVGPNREFLATLYGKHNKLLLEYDRERMRETFEEPK